MYDINTHGDFKRYYDTTQKRNYWALGYFGGGAVPILDAYELAKQFSELVKVPLDTVKMDEVFESRRYKHFKIMFSSAINQTKEEGSYDCDNVWKYLSD